MKARSEKNARRGRIGQAPTAALFCAASLFAINAWSRAHGEERPAANANDAAVGAERLPPIDVSAPNDRRLGEEGSAADGYRVDTAHDVGPWANMPIMRAPYSISVAPKELMENMQITVSDQYWQRNPFTQAFNTTDWGSPNRVATRGFFNNYQFLDGLQTLDIVNSLEDKQSVQVINGLSGLFYGATSVGGVLNSTFKRPTAAPFGQFTAGSMFGAGANAYAHADFGGPIDQEGRLAYRLNLVGQNGDGYTNSSQLRRGLVSTALDFHVTDELLLQFDLQKSWYQTKGTGPTFIFFGSDIPSAPSTRRQWGQSWARYDVGQFRGAVKATWTVDPSLTVRAAYSGSHETTDQLWTNEFVAKDLTITQAMAGLLRDSYFNESAYLQADGRFATGFLNHHVVLESRLYSFTSVGPADSFVFQSLPGSCSIFVPCAQQPSMAIQGATGTRFKGIANNQYDNIVADEIEITDQLSLIGGMNYAIVVNRNFAQTGSISNSYHAEHVSPGGSIVFRPIPEVSTYFTYMQGLEAGSTAASTFNGLPVTNGNAVSPPIVDHQYELGAKARVGDLFLTLSLFDIERSSNVYAPNGSTSYTFLPSGLEEHRGVEVGVSGKLTPALTLWGGATWFDAKITKQSQDPSLVGKAPTGVAQAMAKFYGEYAVDAVPGLMLTGGVYWTGPQWIDVANTRRLPGYVFGDLGVRYNTRLYDHDFVFRVNASNVTGENYWLQTSQLGVPRTVLATAEVKF